jgi:hypothetical protein
MGLATAQRRAQTRTSLFTPNNRRLCTAFASIALLVQNGRYHVDRSDKMSVETMDSLCIPDPSTFNATAALSHVAECISQSCVVSRLGQCSDDVRSLGAIEIQASNLEVMNSRLTQYCEGTHLGFSADIAGPGVSLQPIPAAK